MIRWALALGAPILLLAGAALLAGRPALVPKSLAGLTVYGPYAALVAAGALAAAFNRGRIVFGALTLGIALGAYQLLVVPAPSSFRAATVLAGLLVFVPLNFAVLAALSERGVLSIHSVPRIALLALEVGFVGWIVATGRLETTHWAWQPLVSAPVLLPTPIPQLGLAASGLALVAIAAAAAVRRTATEPGLGWALVAFVLAAHASDQPVAFALFAAAAGLVLVLATLRDSHRMAYRDELTRLLGRRALNERLAALGRRYAVAMVDVDHFKRFNDRYGHDVGDQVLRMVASRLKRVGGGGKPFRYGGEEFTVLFPGKGMADALPHLEALRADIEAYAMALRGDDRPAGKRAGRRKRAAGRSRRTVSVTVSIGVAERSERHDAPDAVIKAADQALYRAKRGGRNQVSR